MNKSERRNFIKTRASARLQMSASAAETLDKIRAEDPDLGGVVVVGVIAPEPVNLIRLRSDDDESETPNSDLLSPAMRELSESCSMSS